MCVWGGGGGGSSIAASKIQDRDIAFYHLSSLSLVEAKGSIGEVYFTLGGRKVLRN